MATKNSSKRMTPADWAALLKKGPEKFNAFRKQHPRRVPVFKGLVLNNSDMQGINLSRASFKDCQIKAKFLD